VPEQDVHRAALVNRFTTRTTTAESTMDKHGWPGTGQSVVPVCRRAAVASPSRTEDTRQGVHCRYGTAGANTRYRPHHTRVPVVRYAIHKRAVTVEKHRIEQ